MSKSKMSIEVANTIMLDWAKFLEITNGPLMMVFFTYIPKSFLPYPKEAIEESLNTAAELFHNQGNAGAVKNIQATIPFLEMYVPDDIALEKASERFNNKKIKKSILATCEEKQKKQLEFILNKYV